MTGAGRKKWVGYKAWALSITLLNATLLTMVTAISTQAQQQNAMGYIPSDPAELEAVKTVRRYRAFTPARVDLSKFTPLPGDQKQMGSCVGWAVAYAARTMQFVWDNNTSRDNKMNIASPAALYNSVYRRENCENGTQIIDALDYMKVIGVPSIAEFPSNPPGQCFRQITPQEIASAERFKIRQFYRISPPGDINRIREQLAQYKPVIIGFNVPRSFHDRQDKGIFRDTRVEPERKGHAIVVVGYDDAKPGGGAFKIINSWGRNWGNGGYRWFSYDAYSKLVDSAFVIETRRLKENIPKPSPEPEPQNQNGSPSEIADQITAEFECAGIKRLDQTGKSILAFAGSEKDSQLLYSQLGEKLPDYETSVEIAPWPQCEALLTFEPYLSNTRGLTLTLNGDSQPKQVPVLFEGDPLVLKITTPDFPAYIYAAYLETDDDGHHAAVHLIQSVSPLEQYGPGTQIWLGDGRDGGPKFTIAGPNFGEEMIALIASASPLYDSARPWEEIERDYLSGIRDALIKANDGDRKRLVAVKFQPLITKPRED